MYIREILFWLLIIAQAALSVVWMFYKDRVSKRNLGILIIALFLIAQISSHYRWLNPIR